jgi:hypothetical protein
MTLFIQNVDIVLTERCSLAKSFTLTMTDLIPNDGNFWTGGGGIVAQSTVCPRVPRGGRLYEERQDHSPPAASRLAA